MNFGTNPTVTVQYRMTEEGAWMDMACTHPYKTATDIGIALGGPFFVCLPLFL